MEIKYLYFCTYLVRRFNIKVLEVLKNGGMVLVVSSCTIFLGTLCMFMVLCFIIIIKNKSTELSNLTVIF